VELHVDNISKTKLIKSSFRSLPNWNNENYDDVLDVFLSTCKTKKSQKIYKDLCIEAKSTLDAKHFFESRFTPYVIINNNENQALLTGYYEPTLKCSLEKNEKYKYPIYTTPKDLVIVDLNSIYPELKNYRLRGRLNGNTLIPYYTREESEVYGVNANVLCYTDSKIDRFFLEIQGSGRVILDDNNTMFIGYDNQNGHKYRSIGKYLVKNGELSLEDVSLQSIRKWLKKNPSKVDEVLNYNKSLIFFRKKEQGATGALGLELTPKRSVAVDKRYIPLGSMLYMSSDINNTKFNRVVFAQDTGGAIKGPVRADLFLGRSKEALDIAGRLKSPLKLWILFPKDKI
jgi:membrane-bound lytic murein transglycosylase A